jgi:hypothetical protein
MSPAFSSTRQATAFALFIFVLLILPALFGKSQLPPREQIYSAIPWRIGAYPYLHQQIFEEKGDIDIAFMGGSVMYYGINTPYVESALSKDLGRKATVITTGWNYGGFDALYFIAQDLLQHRKVHTLVFLDIAEGAGPHPASPYWFRMGDNAEALAGMPRTSIPRYYFAAILGMPRNLLSLIRPNLPDYLFTPDRLAIPGFHPTADDPSARLGSLAVEIGFNYSEYADYTPVSQASPADACVYSPATADQFHFAKAPLNPLQLFFLRKLGALAKAKGTQLVLITFPNTDTESDSFIQEKAFWPDCVQSEVAMVGFPPAKLYSGIPPQDITRLFHDSMHLNKNGQEYFTKLITPALLRTYETQSKY